VSYAEVSTACLATRSEDTKPPNGRGMGVSSTPQLEVKHWIPESCAPDD